jgi:iron(III) transport system substrate-binding protein
VEIAHFQNGDLGNLALITGAGILKTSDQNAQARDFLRFLLSKKAQSAAAKVANEYPVVPSASVPAYMTPPETALRRSSQFDVDRLQDLDETLELLRSVGAI